MTCLRRAARYLLLAAAILSCTATVRAASVPTGFQEYRVLGHEEHVYDMFLQHTMDAFAFGYALSNAMLSVVSVTASTDNQIITYEHWEDGSQLVFGDADSSNGRACDFIPGASCVNNDAIDDVVNQGTTLTFASTTIPNTPADPQCASGGNLATDCVPIPRAASDVRYDGGDLIRSSGGPITLVHVQEPIANQPGRLGGAVEVLPLQAVRNATSYSVPVGEDTYGDLGGSNSPGEPFRRVHLDLVAFEDNTSVQVTSPGAGTVNFTLQRGQHWSSQGAIDTAAGPVLTINEGTKVSVDKPVAGLIFTSSDQAHATRIYALLPDLLHSNDYIITAPGDDPAVNGNRDHDLYVYNPSPTSTISVTATDSLGSNSFNVPANSAVAYSLATGRAEVPADSTVRLSSASNFWGISAYDSQSTSVDWGHSWLAVDFLNDVYTIPYAPDNPNRTTTPPDPAAAPGSASAGASPAFASATTDNTCVRVDFNNDGTFDMVRDGAGALVAHTCTGGYLVDALQALRIYDNNAADGSQVNDISGARVEANKPIAMSYGLDSDSSPATGVGILDLGYAVYPADQRFLNPVLTIEKTPDRTSVPAMLPPGQGTLVTYTLEVRAYDSGPLTNLGVTDLLPTQVSGGACVDAMGPGSGYVCNSTTITYPDLSTETGSDAEPEFTAGSRDQLLWDDTAFSPKSDTLQTNEVLLIQYQVRIESGAIDVLRNDSTANAQLGAGSFFTPTASAEVVRTDVTLDKAVTDDGSPEAGELVTYTLTLTNASALAAETGVIVTDPIPANMTFEPATATSSVPGIMGSFNGGQNAVVWTGTLAASETATLTFQARINALTASGTAIHNAASYASDQTTEFDSNTVTTTVVGPDLVINKVAVGNPNPVHPGETVTFEITVNNVGAGAANNLLIQDPIQVNGTYQVNSLEWRLNAEAFQPLTDADDGDEGGGAQGRFVANQAEFELLELAPGQDMTFRFKVTVTGADGSSIANDATVSSDEVAPADTALVQIPIVGDGVINGHLYVDTDGNGTQDLGEPNLANVDVIVTDDTTAQYTVTTDASGNYTITVPTANGGLTTLDVDETDPDFPTGAVLVAVGPLTPGGCTGTKVDPQSVTAVAPGPVIACDRGFQPASITVSKGSDAPPDGVTPGSTITYSVQVDNTSGVNQSSVSVTDPVVAGTTFVGASTQVSAPPIRVTEYFLDTGTGQFTGTTFDLTLNQDLQPNYYVIIQGSAGDGTGNGNRGADDNYARLTADPFGTGELAASGATNVISLARGAAPEDWVGVVTVVESLPNADADGFILRDVREVDHAGASTAGTEDITGTWTDINQVMLMGGYNGAGCSTIEAATANTKVCHARIFPDNAPQQRVRWTRDAGGATLSAATSTVMAVEWGASWTVQRVRVQGNNGGDGANAPGEYNTAAIANVNRNNTWVWGTGHTNDQGIGDASEGVLVTLGNGVNQNASETLVAVGLEYAGRAVDFEVYALSHPELAVDYRFKADGDGGETQVDVAVDPQPFNRMALASNGQNGTGNAYPRPMFSARYTAPGTVRLERRRSGQAFPAWVQGISFAGVDAVSTGGAQPNLASGYELPPGSSLMVTYQVLVNDPLAGGITQISNTATATSSGAPGGESDALTLDVVRPAVSVETNGAGSVTDDGSNRTIDFLHTVTNDGATDDSFALEVFSESLYRIDLIDPATGVIIATDSNGDGMWDGSPPNTGTLGPGGFSSHIVRVTVPTGSTVPGDSDRVELRATSDASNSVTGSGFDKITVVNGTDDGEADVVVSPDNATFAPAGAQAVYTHTVTYIQGSPNDVDPLNPPVRAFALQAHTSLPGWTATIYQDSNNDGIYTAGVDTAITSTTTLNAGDSQRVFVVVDVPGGTSDGVVARTALTASFFDDKGTPGDVSDDISLGSTANDTTTVGGEGNNDLGFTVSGGGTQVVGAGDTATYSGELGNLGTTDRFEFTVSPSVYADDLLPPPAPNQPDDGLPHATELWLDTDGDGDIGDELTPVAVDTNGDGLWDDIDVNGTGSFGEACTVGVSIFDFDCDGNPDLSVNGGVAALYELRRPVDASQGPYSDPVTLSVTSATTGNTDAVTVTTSVQAVTLAIVEALEAFKTKKGVYVRWSTSSERGTVGFTLERLDEKKGRWKRVRSKLLPALMHSRLGGVYQLRDRKARVGQRITYRLIELEATGATLEHGPYTVVVSGQAPADVMGHKDTPLPGYERVARAMDRLARERAERKIAARHAANLKRRARKGPVIKMSVTETGMYQVSAARIAEVMGESENAVRRLIRFNRIQVVNSGNRVATHTLGDGSLLFYGEAPEGPYAVENVYLLRRGKGYRMRAIGARSPAAVDGQTHGHTAHAEGNRYYLTHLFDDPDGDYWMWDFRFEDMVFDFNEPEFLVDTPDADTTGIATVTVQFHGGLEALHRARISMDGVDTGPVETQWEGLTPHAVSFDVPAAALASGTARIEVTGLGSGDPGRPSTFYINDIRIQYARRHVARGGELAVPHTPRKVSTIDGFQDPGVMAFDVTLPERVQRIKGVTVEDSPHGLRVSLNPRNSSLRRLLAVEPAALREPVSLVADTPSLLRRRDHSVDWLLITSHDMLDAAQTLADHRRTQGLRTMVVDIEDVYDEFAHGVRDADAIWRLLNYAYRKWRVAPRYVVLGGEGSFDFKDYLGHGDSIIPTLLAPTADGLFPSDNLFADVSGNDFLPEMAIGRLPVIDAEELAAVVAKIIAYEASSGDWTERAVFGADPKDLGGDFVESSARVQDAIPPGAVALESLIVDPETLPMVAARAQLHASLNEGRAFLNFFGHAATGSFGNLAPGLINTGDLTAATSTLDNGENLPVVTAFTCLLGQFGAPGIDSVGELLLLTPERGAAAVFAPSGLSRNLLAETLGEGFYRSTYVHGERVIGDVILGAQAHYAGKGGDMYLLDIYNLLGDPATIIK